MNEPIVTFEQVSYQYADGTLALDRVNLTIEIGKKIAIIGNNGAGKSTLFLLLNGILKPTSGSILFDGKKLTYSRKEMKELRQQVGIVFQNPETQLFSSNVYDDIKFGPKNLQLSSAEIERRVNEVMIVTETELLKDTPPHFLSIGQKKRVAIAGIVAMDPKLMVLDEPTAGLDPYYSKKIMALLKVMHHPNRTIILSTHNVDLVYEWADEVIILFDGHLLAQGSVVDVFRNTEILAKSHLQKPWIMEVYERFHGTDVVTQKYPKTKEELFEILEIAK
ncbi:energy-coupling factor ABC transporter ATP-binding protein [Desulfuribacillus stibiiarsenatis]|uniref:ABC transporter ATP-binding protein n=1 Tax=Desulfuribacillus stibiiarsenatis TaxID=1390249 RepID=A0A1E5L4P0_9FIRM|nr:ATP-binding cassette domain-containing protein [Desulfuribacillus stibiiarsenatis]OEH85081.1 energy-coupling factor ABC transporter ATP-binding protein [Desulfuribacillus stibiiarsenatis]